MSPTVTATPRLAFSRRLKIAMWSMTNGRCFYCGLHTNPFVTFQIDHIVPLVRGGSNDIRNLVPCCDRCNAAKGVKSLDAWRPRQPFWFLSETFQREHAITRAIAIDDWLLGETDWEADEDAG